MAKRSNEIIKRLGIDELPAEIVDEDTGEVILNSPERLARALSIIDEVQHDVKRIGRTIAGFFDEKLYLYLGVTKEDAAERFFGMSLSTVRELQRVSRNFGEHLDDFSHLGISRLDLIAQLPEETRKRFITNKVLKLADGTELTLEEIAQTRVKEFKEQIRELKKDISVLRTNEAEFKKTEAFYEEKIQQMEKDNEYLARRLNTPPEEEQFHRKITSIADARRKLQEAESTFYAAFMYLRQIELNDQNKNAVIAGVRGIVTTISENIADIEALFNVSLAREKRVVELVK